MKFLLLILSTASLFASTNLYDLELLTVHESFEHQGQLVIEFNVETTNINQRGASENLMIAISTDYNFQNADVKTTYIYESNNGIPATKTSYTFPLPLGNGSWFVKIAFAEGTSVVDIVKHGYGPGDGWTYVKQTTIENGYESPRLQLPTQPDEQYNHDELTLRWNLSNGIDSYFLEVSNHPDFLAGNGFVDYGIYLTHTDSGTYKLDLTTFGEGFIYFKLKGILPNGDSTMWDYSQLWYVKPTTSYYFFPWLTEDDRGSTLLSIDTGGYSGSVKVDFGVRPWSPDGYGSEIAWRTRMVLPNKIFMEDISKIMLISPEYIHQGVLNVRTSRPVTVTIHQHLKISPDAEGLQNVIKTTDRLEEGSSAEMVIPGFEMDEYHTPALIIGNFDQSDYLEGEYASVRWTLVWNDENGQLQELTDREDVPPQGNVAIIFTRANFPTLPKRLLGTLRLENSTPNIPVAGYYSLSNNPDNGIQLFNFMMAKQTP